MLLTTFMTGAFADAGGSNGLGVGFLAPEYNAPPIRDNAKRQTPPR